MHPFQEEQILQSSRKQLRRRDQRLATMVVRRDVLLSPKRNVQAAFCYHQFMKTSQKGRHLFDISMYHHSWIHAFDRVDNFSVAINPFQKVGPERQMYCDSMARRGRNCVPQLRFHVQSHINFGSVGAVSRAISTFLCS